jgi:hypothetical protein
VLREAPTTTLFAAGLGEACRLNGAANHQSTHSAVGDRQPNLSVVAGPLRWATRSGALERQSGLSVGYSIEVRGRSATR